MRTGDEDMGGAVLAVVDEEVGLGALRQRVLARVRVGRPLRHPLSLPLGSLSCCGGRRRTGTASGAWGIRHRQMGSRERLWAIG